MPAAWLLAGLAWLGAAAALFSPHTLAASISTYEFSLGGTDSLTFVVDSLAASTFSNRILRYRPDTSSISKMASDVSPNSNLVALGTSVWFTTRDTPYRIGRADLTTVTGEPSYFVPAAIIAPFDDMTLGPDGSLWATSSDSGRVVRVTQLGTMTTFAGNGRMRPAGIAHGNDGGIWFADRASRSIKRIDSVTGVIADFPVPQLSAATIPERVASSPSSSAIWFATQDGFGSVDAVTGAVHVVATQAQQPRRLAAGGDGTVWTTDGTAYITQFTPPSTYARLKVFDNDDAQSSGLFVDPSGVIYVSDPKQWHLARVATAVETPADATVSEFYNASLDHYFITADAAEALAIDRGAAGPGWSRTGASWKTWVGGPIPNATEVCRFYGSNDIDPATKLRRGPNSHFYTVQPGECAAVKLDAGWTYESAGKFWMVKPSAIGSCPSSTQPVYRAYNGRYAMNDSNHRYTPSAAIYSHMLTSGWSGEGVVMCAPV